MGGKAGLMVKTIVAVTVAIYFLMINTLLRFFGLGLHFLPKQLPSNLIPILMTLTLCVPFIWVGLLKEKE